VAKEMDALAKELATDYGPALAKHPALEDVTKLCEEAARHLVTLRALKETVSGSGDQDLDVAGALALREPRARRRLSRTAEALGAERSTFPGEVFQAVQEQRTALWRRRIKEKINWELFDRGMETYTWLALEELAKASQTVQHDSERNLVEAAP